MKKTVDDKDIIFKIITHKKCQIISKGKRSRLSVDGMILEMPTLLSNKISMLNKTKKFGLLKELIADYLHIIDKNF